MNNNDTVIGHIYPNYPSDYSHCYPRAFVWDKINGIRDLSSVVDSPLPLPFWRVLSINDHGEILVIEPTAAFDTVYSYNYWILGLKSDRALGKHTILHVGGGIT